MLTVPSVTPDAISELSAREMRRAVVRRWLFRFSVLIGWIAFIGVWYLFSRLIFNPQQLPEPHVVASESWTLITERDFRTNMQASLLRVLGGFLLAVVVSIGLGWLIAYNAWWRTLLRTIVQLVVSTPIVSLAILTLVVFGVSSLGPVIVTALVATPYIMMNVAQGLTGVDRRLIVMSESFGRTRPQIISGVLLPSSLISVLAGGPAGLRGGVAHGAPDRDLRRLRRGGLPDPPQLRELRRARHDRLDGAVHRRDAHLREPRLPPDRTPTTGTHRVAPTNTEAE